MQTAQPTPVEWWPPLPQLPKKPPLPFCRELREHSPTPRQIALNREVKPSAGPQHSLPPFLSQLTAAH